MSKVPSHIPNTTTAIQTNSQQLSNTPLFAPDVQNFRLDNVGDTILSVDKSQPTVMVTIRINSINVVIKIISNTYTGKPTSPFKVSESCEILHNGISCISLGRTMWSGLYLFGTSRVLAISDALFNLPNHHFLFDAKFGVFSRAKLAYSTEQGLVFHTIQTPMSRDIFMHNIRIYLPLFDTKKLKLNDVEKVLHTLCKADSVDIIHTTPPSMDTLEHIATKNLFADAALLYGERLLNAAIVSNNLDAIYKSIGFLEMASDLGSLKAMVHVVGFLVICSHCTENTTMQEQYIKNAFLLLQYAMSLATPLSLESQHSSLVALMTRLYPNRIVTNHIMLHMSTKYSAIPQEIKNSANTECPIALETFTDNSNVIVICDINNNHKFIFSTVHFLQWCKQNTVEQYRAGHHVSSTYTNATNIISGSSTLTFRMAANPLNGSSLFYIWNTPKPTPLYKIISIDPATLAKIGVFNQNS